MEKKVLPAFSIVPQMEPPKGLEIAEDRGVKDSGIPCAIPTCKGFVITKTFKRLPENLTGIIVGPGSINQMITVTEKYCSECGVSYKYDPGKVPK